MRDGTMRSAPHSPHTVSLHDLASTVYAFDLGRVVVYYAVLVVDVGVTS